MPLAPAREWHRGGKDGIATSGLALPFAEPLPPGEVCVTESEDKGFDQLKRCDNGADVTYSEGHVSPDRVRDGAPTVYPPEGPPSLTPEAARALLRIIRSAYARRIAEDFDPLASDRRT